MNFAVRSVAVAAALTFAPIVGAPAAACLGMHALSSTLAEVSVAHAEPGRFAGRTKYERKMNEDFYAVPPGQDPTGLSVTTTIELIGAEREIPSTTAHGSNAGVRFHGSIGGAGPYEVSVEWQADPNDASDVEIVTIEVPDLLPVADDTASKGVGSYGIKVRARAVDDEGSVRLVVSNADPAWDPTRVGKVTVTSGGAAIPLERGVTRLKFEAPLDVDDDLEALLDGATYIRRATLVDPDGAVLDTAVLLDVVGGDDQRPTAEKIRIVQSNTGVNVVTYTRDPDLAVADVAVRVIDTESGKSLVDATSSTPAGIERQFASTLTFEDPVAAAGETYAVVLDLRDADGKSVGEAEVDVGVTGLDAADGEGDTYFDVVIDGVTTEAVIRIAQTDDNEFVAFGAVVSDRVEAMDLVFVDYTGPAPVPTELGMPVVGEWHRWVHKGKAGVGAIGAGGLGHVEVTVIDSEGALLDVSGGSIDELPTNLYSNGSGTKNATTTTSARPELL